MQKQKLDKNVQIYKNEPNLIGIYSQGALAEIVSAMRNDIINRFKNTVSDENLNESSLPIKIKDELMKKAQREVDKIRKTLDNPTFSFAQDLSDLVFGIAPSVHTVMVCDGILYGKDQNTSNTQISLPINLGKNPYPLFKKHHTRDTIDSTVTDEQVITFMDETRRVNLFGAGYNRLDIHSSRFFYISEQGLAPFKNPDGSINMAKLLPLISYIPGKILIDDSALPVTANRPSLDEAVSQIPVFLSYRLKQSLDEKSSTRLSQRSKFKIDDQISDWVAHRICVDSEEKVSELYQLIKQLPTIGRAGGSKITEIMFDKNYYRYPKDNGYRAIKLRVMAKTGKEKVLREIQIVDREQYWHNELSITSPQSRFSYEREKRQFEKGLPADVLKALYHYSLTLKKVFGKSVSSLNLETGKMEYSGHQAYSR